MRFPSGQDFIEVPVQWFFADDLPILQGGTPYGSTNWRGEDEKPPEGIGEVVGATRRWVNGANPNPFCCTPSDTHGGARLGGIAPVWLDVEWTGLGGMLLDGSGVFLTPFIARGGLLLDGSGAWGSGLAGLGGLLLDGSGAWGSSWIGQGGGLLLDGSGAWGSSWTGQGGGLLLDGSSRFGSGWTGLGGLLLDGSSRFGSGFTSKGGGLQLDGSGVWASTFSSGGGGLAFDGVGDWATGGGSDDVTGTIVGWGATTVPAGWLECDGSSVSTTTFGALFAILGTTWGPASGGNFTLPDFRGRGMIGAGTGSGLTPRTLAASGGEENHTLTTGEMPAHTHSQDVNTLTNLPPAQVQSSVIGGINRNQGGTTQSAGGGGSHNNMAPFKVVKWIIKT